MMDEYYLNSWTFVEAIGSFAWWLFVLAIIGAFLLIFCYCLLSCCDFMLFCCCLPSEWFCSICNEEEDVERGVAQRRSYGTYETSPSIPEDMEPFSNEYFVQTDRSIYDVNACTIPLATHSIDIPYGRPPSYSYTTSKYPDSPPSYHSTE